MLEIYNVINFPKETNLPSSSHILLEEYLDMFSDARIALVLHVSFMRVLDIFPNFPDIYEQLPNVTSNACVNLKLP